LVVPAIIHPPEPLFCLTKCHHFRSFRTNYSIIPPTAPIKASTPISPLMRKAALVVCCTGLYVAVAVGVCVIALVIFPALDMEELTHRVCDEQADLVDPLSEGVTDGDMTMLEELSELVAELEVVEEGHGRGGYGKIPTRSQASRQARPESE